MKRFQYFLCRALDKNYLLFAPESVTQSTGEVSSVAADHHSALVRTVRDPARQNFLEPKYFHLADSKVIVSTAEIFHHQTVALQTW